MLMLMLQASNYRKSPCIRRTFLMPKFFFFIVSIYGAMPGNVSQLSNQCVDSPLGNYNNTQICLSSWFESNLSNRSQYVVYNNNSSKKIFYNKWCTTRCTIGTIGTLLFWIYINDLTHSSKNDIVTIICEKFTSTNQRLQLHLDVKWRSFPAWVFGNKTTKQQQQKNQFFFFFSLLEIGVRLIHRCALYTEIYGSWLNHELICKISQDS